MYNCHTMLHRRTLLSIVTEDDTPQRNRTTYNTNWKYPSKNSYSATKKSLFWVFWAHMHTNWPWNNSTLKLKKKKKVNSTGHVINHATVTVSLYFTDLGGTCQELQHCHIVLLSTYSFTVGTLHNWTIVIQWNCIILHQGLSVTASLS